MWSVWAERVDVYALRGVAYVAVRGRGVDVVRGPTTAPLASLLDKVAERIKAAQTLQGRRLVVSVFLGAQLCPPVRFAVPEGARWRDFSWLAQREAAMQWGMDPSKASAVGCALSPTAVGLAAAMPSANLDAVTTWVNSLNGSCLMIKPMWSHLSSVHARLLRRSRRLVLVEPDGTVTNLCVSDGRCTEASSGCAETDLNDTTTEDAKSVHLSWHLAAEGEPKNTGPVQSWANCFAIHPKS